MASAASFLLGEAAQAALSLPPDGGLRLRSMASWIDGTTLPAPVAARPVDGDKLQATLQAHAQMAAGMLQAEIAASAVAGQDTGACAKQMANVLYQRAQELGYFHLSLPSLPTLRPAGVDGPMHVRDEEELGRRRRSVAAKMAQMVSDPGTADELREIFDTMAKDPRGGVSVHEWQCALAKPDVFEALKRHFGDATKEEVAAAFSIIDVDDSGTIEWAEMVVASKAYLAAEAASDMCMTPEGVAALKRLFDLIDKDRNGSVSSKEWGAAVGKPATREHMMEYFGGITAAECGKMFARIDVDGSGTLTFDEFIAATASYGARSRLADLMALERSRNALKALFDALDVDGNGEVDSREWGRAVRTHADTMSKFFGGDASKGLQHIGKAFKTIDKDGSGTLSWDEFERFCKVRV